MNHLNEQLSNQIQGRVIVPGDPSYEETRQIWNAMIDRRPAVIVECACASDVPVALAYARDNNIEISVRGAGHNIAGNAICDGGLMIDLSKMNNIRVEPSKRRAYVEPGATLGDFDTAVQQHGLATPVGINSTLALQGSPSAADLAG